MDHTPKILALAVLLACGAAQAANVTALPGSTAIVLPVTNSQTAGPMVMAPGITWSSDDTQSVYGYNGGYGFQSNGDWETGLSMIGTNNGTGTMRIDFASAVLGFGGLLNWSRFSDGRPDGSPAVIAAYDSNNVMLESYTLTFGPLGGNNLGEFHGFLRGNADISAITFTGAYIGAANLEVMSAPVPEPGTYAMMALGLLGLGLMVRRKA